MITIEQIDETSGTYRIDADDIPDSHKSGEWYLGGDGVIYITKGPIDDTYMEKGDRIQPYKKDIFKAIEEKVILVHGNEYKFRKALRCIVEIHARYITWLDNNCDNWRDPDDDHADEKYRMERGLEHSLAFYIEPALDRESSDDFMSDLLILLFDITRDIDSWDRDKPSYKPAVLVRNDIFNTLIEVA